MTRSGEPTFFQRYLLPGLALKGVIIGGGYATGRELVEYFLSQGPTGAVLGMLLAVIVWSLISALTFAVAIHLRAFDYHTFIYGLLGRATFIFEVCFVAFSTLLLAVFGAAAGEVVASVLSVPTIVGTIILAFGIAVVASVGEAAVEMMFKYVSVLLYAVYAIFLILALSRYGAGIEAAFNLGAIGDSWPLSGLTYGAYNAVAVVMILPVLRHITSRRDAIVSGALAGPLAMLPALAFLVAMIGFYPEILPATLPSDYILQRMDSPIFRVAFQFMVFCALLESGVGVIHAINERALTLFKSKDDEWRGPNWIRAALTLVLLSSCMFVANSIGLVDLIASGYRVMAMVFLVTFIIPLLTIGVAKLFRRSPARIPSEEMHVV